MIGPTVHDGVRGSTFSEVMVAMALTSVGVMGTMGAFEAADKSLRQDALAARALSMAESRLEAKRAVPWGQLLADDLDHDGVSDMTMHDDGIDGDRLAGDGIYSARVERQGVTVVWTAAFPHSDGPAGAGAVLIEARGMYAANGGDREIRLATLRANPAFAENH
jgi:hypothetical protein